MKATFSSTKKVDFKPIDSNEEILLENMNDISEGRLKMTSEIEKDKKSFSLEVAEPDKIVINDNLAEKTITMQFPTKYYEKERASIESHDIIITKGGMKFICEVDEQHTISIKLIFSEDAQLLLFKQLEDGTVLTNVQLIKMAKDIDMTVIEVNTESYFYKSFMI